MDNFVAIDFETAKANRSSVCSVGLVIVKEGKIVEEIYRLIKPTPNFYSFYTTRVHGLTAKDTDNEKTFDEVWEELSVKIGSLPLVAHNAAFDESCLRAAHGAYGLWYPDYNFYCTYRGAQKLFANELCDFQLPTVSARCGYDLSCHHNAIADARSCAYIALVMF